MTQKTERKKAICPECGREYMYLDFYKPSTCNSYDCIHKHLHPELRKKKKMGAKGNA